MCLKKLVFSTLLSLAGVCGFCVCVWIFYTWGGGGGGGGLLKGQGQ